MKPNKYFVYSTLAILFLLAYCAEEPVFYDDPSLLEIEEFTFVPKAPESADDVSMVYYGCDYNETTSVTVNDRDIWVRKQFNGAMKRPCILAYDTISFGTLQQGTYEVTLKIIDINPFAADSVFHIETKTLKVVK